MSTPAQAKAAYAEAFRLTAAAGAPEWLGRERREAMRRFEEIGFPGPKNEDWKYTSVSPIVAVPFHRALGKPGVGREGESVRAEVEEHLAARGLGPAASTAVVVNGRFAPDLSRLGDLGRGIAVRGLGEDLAAPDSLVAGRLGTAFDMCAHGFAALNAAFASDGVVVRAAAGSLGERTLHLVFVTLPGAEPVASTTRTVVLLEEGSGLTLVEHHVGGEGTSLTNAGVEISLSRGATLRHVKVQDESGDAYHVARSEVDVDEGAAYVSHAVTLGARLSRNEIAVRLRGKRAEARLSGLYVLDGERHADHHTWIDHAVADTKSFETYKGVLDGRARGVFTGRVLVRPDAQHIEARQANKNLILSDGAVVETRPQLEIYADDVQCSHGAAIGRLDEAAMFYLRQRGLDPAAARALLTWAFADEVLSTLPDEATRSALCDLVHRRIAGARTVEEVAR